MFLRNRNTGLINDRQIHQHKNVWRLPSPGCGRPRRRLISATTTVATSTTIAAAATSAFAPAKFNADGNKRDKWERRHAKHAAQVVGVDLQLRVRHVVFVADVIAVRATVDDVGVLVDERAHQKVKRARVDGRRKRRAARPRVVEPVPLDAHLGEREAVAGEHRFGSELHRGANAQLSPRVLGIGVAVGQ